jgi:hypothetical protein
MQKYSTSNWPSESQDLFILSCATTTGKWSTLGTSENLYLFVMYAYNQNRELVKTYISLSCMYTTKTVTGN